MLNKCTFIGRLGKDPDSKYTAAGKAVTSVSLAVSEKYKGEETTEWINLVFFETLAEVAIAYLKKGSLVYVECKQKTEKWTDKNGQDRYKTVHIVREMKMLSSSKPDAPPTARTEARTDQAPSFDDMDDDIPF